MLKLILKTSVLILGLVFLSSANAETCKAQYNKQQFDHVNIWKSWDHTAYCYYRANCIGTACPPGAIYFMLGYEPKDGPWKSDAVLSSCSGSAEDCRFQKVEN